MQAHALGEVGTLGTVLLRVYSGTLLPIFIEIGSYLTDKEQKISWHSFFLRHGVVCNYNAKRSSRDLSGRCPGQCTATTSAGAAPSLIQRHCRCNESVSLTEDCNVLDPRHTCPKKTSHINKSSFQSRTCQLLVWNRIEQYSHWCQNLVLDETDNIFAWNMNQKSELDFCSRLMAQVSGSCVMDLRFDSLIVTG